MERAGSWASLLLLMCTALNAADSTTAAPAVTKDERKEKIESLIKQIPLQLDEMFYKKGFKDGNGILIFLSPAFQELRRFCTLEEYNEVKREIYIPKTDPFSNFPPRVDSSSTPADATASATAVAEIIPFPARTTRIAQLKREAYEWTWFLCSQGLDNGGFIFEFTAAYRELRKLCSLPELTVVFADLHAGRTEPGMADYPDRNRIITELTCQIPERVAIGGKTYRETRAFFALSKICTPPELTRIEADLSKRGPMTAIPFPDQASRIAFLMQTTLAQAQRMRGYGWNIHDDVMAYRSTPGYYFLEEELNSNPNELAAVECKIRLQMPIPSNPFEDRTDAIEGLKTQALKEMEEMLKHGFDDGQGTLYMLTPAYQNLDAICSPYELSAIHHEIGHGEPLGPEWEMQPGNH